MAAECVYSSFLSSSEEPAAATEAAGSDIFSSFQQCSNLTTYLTLIAPAFLLIFIIPQLIFNWCRRRRRSLYDADATRRSEQRDDYDAARNGVKRTSLGKTDTDQAAEPFLLNAERRASAHAAELHLSATASASTFGVENDPAYKRRQSSYQAIDFACFILTVIATVCFVYKLVVTTVEDRRNNSNGSAWSIFDAGFQLAIALLIALLVLRSRLTRRRGARNDSDTVAPGLERTPRRKHSSLTSAADSANLNGDTRALLFIFFMIAAVCRLILLTRSVSRFSSSTSSVSVFFVIDCLILGCDVILLLLYGFTPRALTSPEDEHAEFFNTPPCPLSTTSPAAVFTFMWVMPLLYYGWQHALKIDHIWQLQYSRRGKTLYYDMFRPKWIAALERAKKAKKKLESSSTVHDVPAAAPPNDDEKVRNSKTSARAPRKYSPPSFIRVLCSTIVRNYVFGLMLLAINLVFKFASPLILKALLASFETDDHNEVSIEAAAGQHHTPRSAFEKRIVLALLLFVCTIIESLLDSHVKFVGINIGYGMMKIMTLALHEKALKLSNDARRTITVGKLLNLISVDQRIFFIFGNFCYFIVNAPVTITISIVLIWRELGAAALAGVLVLIIIIPLNSFISTRQRSYYHTQLRLKDERLRQVSEMVHGIRILKLYAWEAPFITRLLKIRFNELKHLRTANLINSVANMLWTTSSFLVLLATFAAFVLTSPATNVLTAQKTFVALALFNLLREPMTMLSQMAMFWVQFKISLKRVSEVLHADEREDGEESVLRLPASANNSAPLVEISNGNFAWSRPESTCAADGVADVEKNEDFKPTLIDINVKIQRNTLTAIVGHVGAGKSSLCAAILGQMHQIKPTPLNSATTAGADVDQTTSNSAAAVILRGSTSYVPQQPWIQNATLFDNVMFMRPIKMAKYNRVVDACALRPDLQILAAGDQTEIGEKGLNLSGGQKQRVSLARAAYSGASIVVLDDPLSAVDAHVGKHIFQRLIANKTGLLKRTTRIMATHNIQLLPFVDNIIVMEHGRIVATGTYKQLIRAGGPFADFLSSHVESSNHQQQQDGGNSSADEAAAVPVDGVQIAGARLRKESGRTSRTNSVAGEDSSTDFATNAAAAQQTTSEQQTNNVNKKAKLIEDEQAQLGTVKATVYWTYAKYITLRFAMSTLLLAAIHCTLSVVSQVWLAAWSSDVETNSRLSAADASSQNIYRLSVYAILGSVDALTILLQSFALTFGSLLASRNVHELVLDRVMHAPTAFFDTNPSGRILNRFSGDVDQMDTQIPDSLLNVLNALINIVSMLCVVVYGSSLYFLLAAAPFAIMYVIVQRFAVTSTAQLRRMESIFRSPMVSYFGESVQGVHVISAMQMEKQVQREFTRLYDQATRPQFCYMTTNRGVNVLLQFIGSLVVLAASVLAILQHDSAVNKQQQWNDEQRLSPSDRSDLAAEATTIDSSSAVGLVISNALAATGSLANLVRIMSIVETSVVSVERMKEYTEIEQEIDREPPTTNAALSAAKSSFVMKEIISSPSSSSSVAWPSTGTVDISSYSARYRPGLDLVLKNITVRVEDGEKLGIVGRTGSGKSSLALALFRMIQTAENDRLNTSSSVDEGRISIDGRDISQLNLFDLRSRLSIIPQDPVVFSGTLRFNLDPWCEVLAKRRSDSELWQALRQAHLHEFVTSLPGGLEFQVGSDGQNLSVGQKQLVCLARALLRQSKILLLDEATAAVDLETDELIQQSIRKEFAQSTVITIAHRINTIIDYNRVMVLDNGRVVEIGEPQELLERGESSEFYKLAVESARKKI